MAFCRPHALCSWSPADGGQLRLFPFPFSPPVDIAPLSDRLVLFASTRMMHRVLPSSASERACFTIWLSQTRRRPQAMMGRRPPVASGTSSATGGLPSEGSSLSDKAEALGFLMQPHIRKHVVKLAFAEEW